MARSNSTRPSFVSKPPVTSQRGQKAWRSAPHGAAGSVPKYDVPSAPTCTPGAVRVTVRSTRHCSLRADLTV